MEDELEKSKENKTQILKYSHFSEKGKYCMISLICRIEKKKNNPELVGKENRFWLPEAGAGGR